MSVKDTISTEQALFTSTMFIKGITEDTGYTPLANGKQWIALSLEELKSNKVLIDTVEKELEQFNNGIREYRQDTELVMFLNWKTWQWYNKDEQLARLYDELWRKADERFTSVYKDNEQAMKYFYSTTD